MVDVACRVAMLFVCRYHTVKLHYGAKFTVGDTPHATFPEFRASGAPGALECLGLPGVLGGLRPEPPEAPRASTPRASGTLQILRDYKGCSDSIPGIPRDLVAPWVPGSSGEPWSPGVSGALEDGGVP